MPARILGGIRNVLHRRERKGCRGRSPLPGRGAAHLGDAKARPAYFLSSPPQAAKKVGKMNNYRKAREREHNGNKR